MSFHTTITVADCKKLKEYLRRAQLPADDDERKVWYKFGDIAIKASATSTAGHMLYFKQADGKLKTSTIRLVDLKYNNKQSTLELPEVKARAQTTREGVIVAPDQNGIPTLDECIKLRLEGVSHKMEEDALRAGDDINRDLRLYARDWLKKPVTEITSPMVATRLKQLKAGEYPHPDFERITKLTPKQREIDGVKLPKAMLGGHHAARKFGCYLRLVMLGTSSTGHGIKMDNNPVSEALKEIGKAKPQRPATCIEDSEIKVVMTYPREKCTHGQSGEFSVDVWRGLLALRLMLLTAYRISDVANLYDGQIKADMIHKGAGEASKSKKSHRLPMTDAIRAILEEAQAIRDADFATLRSCFGWTDDQVDAFSRKYRKSITAEPTDAMFNLGENRIAVSALVFPMFKDGRRRYKVAAQLTRPAMMHLKRRGQIDKVQRLNKDDKPFKHGPDLFHNHDLRATFITQAINAGCDPFAVGMISNHELGKVSPVMTREYMTGNKIAKPLAKAMKKVSKRIHKIAAR